MAVSQTQEQQRRKMRRLLLILFLVVIGMTGFGYALVPMYNVLCSQLGINGKTSGKVSYTQSEDSVDMQRSVKVQFLTSRNASLPWEFYPQVRQITVHPGESKRVSFYAKNRTDNAMTVQAIPSVTPAIAAKYLLKTECFCFTRQTLGAHIRQDMPLIFHLDRALPKNIRTVTLSYTLFDTDGITRPLARPQTEEGRFRVH